MLVRGRMTREVVAVSPSQTLAEALTLTRTHRIRHLPVLDGSRLVGVVSERDLRLAAPPVYVSAEAERRRILSTRSVAEVMTTELVTTTPDTPVEEAARLLYEHHIGSLPVLEAGSLVGILTETDLLRAFVELFGGRERSSRIEVRMPNRPGELARVVRLIGVDRKVNITGMVLPPQEGSESVAIIHLQLPDPSELVEALEKMGYRVGWPSLDVAPAGPVLMPSSPAPRLPVAH